MMPSERHPDGLELQAYFDGELDPAQARAVQAHCETCPECRTELGALSEVSALLLSTPAPELPRPIWGEVRPMGEAEFRFKPLWGAAACAAGIALGVLIGPTSVLTGGDAAETEWTQTSSLWSGETTSSLLGVYEVTGE